ncbi:MAG: hypothetical protein KKB20_21275, partial [Proteobacteria bacterium]|nr:hypothetical protein [Pseudomonadota bacterium]
MMIRPEIEEEAEGIAFQGGEIPEVALHESLNYLARNGLDPGPEERRRLEAAVVERYQDIIRRDLNPNHRGLGLFRGPQRARINLKRLSAFARNHGFPLDQFIEETGDMFLRYLQLERRDVEAGRSYNTLGLTPEELPDFMIELGLDEWRDLEWIDAISAVPSLD